MFAGTPPRDEVFHQGEQEVSVPNVPILSADRAAWLTHMLNSFATLVAYLAALKRASVSGDHEMYDSALAGAVRGQAREIIQTLGYRPGENLEPYYDYDSRNSAHI